MFWLPALVNGLKSNSDQTNANSMNNAQNMADQQSMIAQKRDQRNQIANNIGNRQTVDIDSIVSSLFPNKKRKTSPGGFNSGLA